ncbi:AraC family transcriptional regulator [Pedobacter psychrophilus]|uniref:AraC family transcriptional regulator n=1 Tax=Pedobacter psychrophilus TaxID=1826909 RepID=A0A179DNA7_9SPHI|nr:helix-turn-helix domain-containing protein [Pedobacter psychrophilus]OAQ42250.1 AraC family transcriptional regulator [Pedobacter psychrophilus]
MSTEYQKVNTLISPANGNLAFKVYSFEDNSSFDHLQRLSYYTVILINKGQGKLKVDFAEYNFTQNTLLCFTPYQPFMIETSTGISGFVINFHPDFFCIHKHQKEVACNGVLFNDIYKPPFVNLEQKDLESFCTLFEQMKVEMKNVQLAQYELLVSYLKIFLITASRLKTNQNPQAKQDVANLKEPFILQNLKAAIEKHFKTKHTANDYALLLNISSKALAKETKTHFNKTLTSLISERIIIEAKRELYLTSKTVKEIAYELGYDDEHYFSRFFKTNAEVSPQFFRETVGFARAEA